MNLTTFVDAGSFLKKTQNDLESNEAANSLMLGICSRLARQQEQITPPPCLKTVEDKNGLVLAAMMTPPHKIVVYGHQNNLMEGALVLAKDLTNEGWNVPGVLGPTKSAKQFAVKWTELTNERYEFRGRQKVYKIEKVKSTIPDQGRLRLAAEKDLALVAQWRCAFHEAIFGQVNHKKERQAAERAIKAGDIYLWEDERSVSMAMKTRPTRNGISISLVYTPPEMRGHGYATACVGELCRQLLASGWEHCAIFAEETNTAAIKAYQKIGFEPICDYDEYEFTNN